MFERAVDNNVIADEAAVDGANQGSSRVSAWEMATGRLLLTLLVILFVADWLFQPGKFQIEEIRVYGESADSGNEQIEKVVRDALDGNFFSTSLKRLEHEVEQLPRVFSASLRRQWPSTIVVNVVEAEFAARWGSDKWLSTAGDLVVRKVNERWDHSALARLDGPEDQAEAVWNVFRQWSGKFAAAGLSLDALNLSPTGLLDFTISAADSGLQREQRPAHGHTADTEVTLIVELQNSRIRVRRFLDALNEGLLARFPEMASVDLRYPHGFAIGWRGRGTAAAADSEPGEA